MLDIRCTSKLSLTVVEVCTVRWICTRAIALRAVLILVMIRCPRKKLFEPGTRKRPTTHLRSADTWTTSARKRSDARRMSQVRAISFRTTIVPHRREWRVRVLEAQAANGCTKSRRTMLIVLLCCTQTKEKDPSVKIEWLSSVKIIIINKYRMKLESTRLQR